MGGEDFSRLGREGIPICMYFLGTAAPEKVAESLKPGGAPLPGLHSNIYFPIPEPSIRTGALTMSCAVLNLLGK
jgi:metal-dependent amidase/aminoacylase/carboxypeptidase family protein